ncbi:MAG: hypothetical protein JW937_08845 [Candidatus Omnitrophica bacterium]|nr:hypothetical protein [Candidatus Omnitrophota bacterium]
MNKKVLLSVLVALGMIGALGVLVGALIWVSSPQYSLKKAQEAIACNDLATFRRYVDVDYLSARVFDSILAGTVEDKGVEEGLAEFGMIGGMSSMDNLKPVVLKRIRQRILEAVELSALEPTAQEAEKYRTASLKKLDLPLLAKDLGLVPGPMPLRTEVLAVENKEARAILVMYSPVLGKEVGIIVGMTEKNGYWRVMEIVNYAELAQHVQFDEPDVLMETFNRLIHEAIEEREQEERTTAGDAAPLLAVVSEGRGHLEPVPPSEVWTEYLTLEHVQINRTEAGGLQCEVVLLNKSETWVHRARLRLFLQDSAGVPVSAASQWLVSEDGPPLDPGQRIRVNFPVVTEGVPAESYGVNYAVDELLVED